MEEGVLAIMINSEEVGTMVHEVLEQGCCSCRIGVAVDGKSRLGKGVVEITTSGCVATDVWQRTVDGGVGAQGTPAGREK